MHDAQSVDPADATEAAKHDVSRRGFLRRAVARTAQLGAVSLAYAYAIEPHWVDIVRRPLRVAGLPKELAGKRIVQISDIHAGQVVDQRWLVGAMERVAELNPDLIVATGDFMTCYFDERVPQALEAMSALPRPPLGTLAVLGNHDYGYGFNRYQVADKLRSKLEAREVRVLCNEVAVVAGLQFAGFEDLWSGRHRAEQGLSQLVSDLPTIALCHNPDAVDHPAWRDFQGWVLVGHTHGGQCRAPFCRPLINPVNNKRYVAGEYVLAPGRRMYINRGLGYLRRVRFNARPEITVFSLARG